MASKGKAKNTKNKAKHAKLMKRKHDKLRKEKDARELRLKAITKQSKSQDKKNDPR